MDPTDRRQVLAKVPLFAEVLGPELLDDLAAKAHVAVFAAAAALMSEGAFGVSMFIIAEGSVTVTFNDSDGVAHAVATLDTGDVVGEMSLMTGARRNATVTARSNVSALEITKVALEEIFARSPELIDGFSVVLCARQAELDRIAADVEDQPHDMARRIRNFFPAIFGGG
jgi:CRP-like cAMP-binding protein